MQNRYDWRLGDSLRFLAGQNVTREVGAPLNNIGRYRNSVFAIFKRVVSLRNLSGPGLKFLFPGLSVCGISLINSLKSFLAAVWHSITCIARTLTAAWPLEFIFHFLIIVKHVWNGTWIYQKPVLRGKCLHLCISGIPMIRSSRTCIKRNVPATEKKIGILCLRYRKVSLYFLM